MQGHHHHAVVAFRGVECHGLLAFAVEGHAVPNQRQLVGTDGAVHVRRVPLNDGQMDDHDAVAAVLAGVRHGVVAGGVPVRALPMQAVIDGGVEVGVLRRLDGQVEDHHAVAAVPAGEVLRVGPRIGVGCPVQGIGVAGGSGLVDRVGGMEGEMEDDGTVAAVGGGKMLFVGPRLVQGHAVPNVGLAGRFGKGGRDGGQHGEMEGQGGGAAVGDDGARAGDEPRRGGLRSRHRKPVGLVRLALADLVVEVLLRALGHEDGLRGCRAAPALVGRRHGVGGGLPRRGVDSGLRTAGVPLVGQRGVDQDRRISKGADGSEIDGLYTVVTTG